MHRSTSNFEDVKVKNILDACKEAGNDNRAYYFFSTSKITFPGAGVSIIASSDDNIAEIKKVMTAQTIGYDKINQHFAMCSSLRMQTESENICRS